MRCVALLSGGKDSVAAIDVARQQGFEVSVALTLRPATDDAWMFHTPNLQVVPAVARCLGLELVEAPVREGEQEELADLQQALLDIKQEHQVQAIISGALASEYQRTRIDRIGHQLGLKTFAPLWHKDRTTYLQQFTGPLWDVRIARAAADGMGPKWCGRRLDAQAIQELATMRTRPDIAGEGGEYETLVLQAPCYDGRIEVEATTEATASRSTWRVRRFRIR